MKRFLLIWALLGCAMAWPAQATSLAAAPPPSLLRLHVLANSESLLDQQVKVRVRDELLAHLDPLLNGVASRDEAVRVVKSALPELAVIANRLLQALGETYQADLQVGEFNFPAKHYGTFTLPAGRYQALNVTLGEGAGRNWWCVVFPPLCLTSEVCHPEQPPAASHTVVIRSWLYERWLAVFAWRAARQ